MCQGARGDAFRGVTSLPSNSDTATCSSTDGNRWTEGNPSPRIAEEYQLRISVHGELFAPERERGG